MHRLVLPLVIILLAAWASSASANANQAPAKDAAEAPPAKHWLDELIEWFCKTFPPKDSVWSRGYEVRPALAILLVGLVCGAVGSLVVGNRMAFFSDALAHCAFAGVALG